MSALLVNSTRIDCDAIGVQLDTRTDRVDWVALESVTALTLDANEISPVLYVQAGGRGRFFAAWPDSILRVRRGRTEQAFPVHTIQSLNLETKAV